MHVGTGADKEEDDEQQALEVEECGLNKSRYVSRAVSIPLR